MDYNVVNDALRSRFEVDVEGMVSYIDYDIRDGKMLFFSTRVHPDLEGRGIASALTKSALGYAIDNGLKIVPICSFTKGYLLKHNDEYKDYISYEN